MTRLKRLNKAGLELRPKPSASLFTACCLLWSQKGRGAGAPGSWHAARAQNPEGSRRRGGGGGVGRGPEWGERRVVERPGLGAACGGEDPLLPPRVSAFPTTAFVDMPCLTKI